MLIQVKEKVWMDTEPPNRIGKEERGQISGFRKRTGERSEVKERLEIREKKGGRGGEKKPPTRKKGGIDKRLT